MITIETIQKTLASHKQELRAKFHVKDIGVFGSYARGEQAAVSDVDILVSFEQPIGLAFVELAEYLESLLGVKVDLVSAGALKPKMREHIEADIVYV